VGNPTRRYKYGLNPIKDRGLNIYIVGEGGQWSHFYYQIVLRIVNLKNRPLTSIVRVLTGGFLKIAKTNGHQI